MNVKFYDPYDGRVSVVYLPNEVVGYAPLLASVPHVQAFVVPGEFAISDLLCTEDTPPVTKDLVESRSMHDCAFVDLARHLRADPNKVVCLKRPFVGDEAFERETTAASAALVKLCGGICGGVRVHVELPPTAHYVVEFPRPLTAAERAAFADLNLPGLFTHQIGCMHVFFSEIQDV